MNNFGDIGCRDVWLLLDLMEPDGTCILVLNVYFKKSSFFQKLWPGYSWRNKTNPFASIFTYKWFSCVSWSINYSQPLLSAILFHSSLLMISLILQHVLSDFVNAHNTSIFRPQFSSVGEQTTICLMARLQWPSFEQSGGPLQHIHTSERNAPQKPS